MKDGLLRGMFTLAVIGMAYRETGPWTAACLILIAVNSEMVAFALRRKANKRDLERFVETVNKVNRGAKHHDQED